MLKYAKHLCEYLEIWKFSSYYFLKNPSTDATTRGWSFCEAAGLDG